jgi:hypothetical protein
MKTFTFENHFINTMIVSSLSFYQLVKKLGVILWSADSNGICAEHFKYGADEIVPVIVNIINKIFKDLDIPEKLKSGVVKLKFFCVEITLVTISKQVCKI